ncbi:hypothetical protein GCM10022409_37890 [Hymenobacter glaciei]|uniref:Right handed beta helix domain-containing protein n=2 Tax=Hymenobacter glaciei TaxID=877209 RepID=A0ABP7UN37_9BACT
MPAAHATRRYVSAPTNQPAGNNSNPGTLALPYATIQYAANLVLPGDTVFVRGGTYTNACSTCHVASITRPGTASKWIVFLNYPGERPLLQFDGWGGFQVRPGGAYIEVNGFRMQGPAARLTLAAALTQNQSCNPDGTKQAGDFNPLYNGHGIEANGRDATSTLGRPHHLRFLNNEVFECGAAGINTIQCDYITVSNNLIYNNCWYTLFGTSAISLYQNWNSDFKRGYHNVVRNNRCFGNRLYVKWYRECAIYDGNGIIIDDSRNSQNGSTLGAFQGRTLITNNVLAGNGGSGIHAYQSDHIEIVNNTAYQNSQTPEINAGEILGYNVSDVFIGNNIIVALADNRLNTATGNQNVTYRNNLFFGGTTAAVLGLAPVQADPLFRNANTSWATADFHLLAGSPAIDAGTATSAPATDFDGRARPQGAGYDIGAFEYSALAQRGGAVAGAPLVTTTANAATTASTLELYPNPSDGSYLTVRYVAATAGPVTLQLLDGLGRVLLTRSVSGMVGENVSSMALAEQVAAGTYTLRLTAPGGAVQHQQLVVLR